MDDEVHRMPTSLDPSLEGSRPSNPDAVKLAERLGPYSYSVQLRLTEDYSGEHREWVQEYTIPQGHPLIGEIAADVAALSRQPYPAPEVERAWKAGFCRGDNRHYPLPPTSEEIDAAWRASKTFKGLTALTGDGMRLEDEAQP